MNMGLRHSRRRKLATQLVAVSAAMIIWELVPRYVLGRTSQFFFPPFSSVLTEFARLVQAGILPQAAAVTLTRTLAAIAIGLVAGTLVGLAMESSRWMKWFFGPIIVLGYPVPKVAFIPIFVLWFGIDDLSKILLATLATFFPIAIATHSAARGVRQSIRWSALTLGAGPVRMFFAILLPATVPGIMSGLQIAVPFAMIVVVVSEMTSSGGGLGNMLTIASRNFQVAAQFSVLFTLMAIGLFLEKGVIEIRRRLLLWE